MFTADSYLWSILDNPGDDSLRLAFADWLEAHREDLHAEFIRLQCLLAAEPEENAVWHRRKRQEEALWKILREQWQTIFTELNLAPVELRDFRRGFLDRPITVVLESLEPWLRGANRWTFFLEIGSLEITCVLSPEFFESPQLQRVVALTCQDAGIEEETLRPFASCPYLRRLRVLNLSRNAIGPMGILSLTACPSLGTLTTLQIDDNHLGDLGVAYLVASPVCRSLEQLELYGNGIGNVGAAAIAGSPYLRSLKALRLDGNLIGDEGVRALAASEAMPRLEELMLGGADLFDDTEPLRQLYTRLGSGFDSWPERVALSFRK